MDLQSKADIVRQTLTRSWTRISAFDVRVLYYCRSCSWHLSPLANPSIRNPFLRVLLMPFVISAQLQRSRIAQYSSATHPSTHPSRQRNHVLFRLLVSCPLSLLRNLRHSHQNSARIECVVQICQIPLLTVIFWRVLKICIMESLSWLGSQGPPLSNPSLS